MIAAIFLFGLILGGLGSTLIKYAGSQIDPMALVFFRSLTSLLIVLPFINKKEILKSAKNLTLLFAGILFSLNWILFAYGIQRTHVFVGQLIYVPTALIVAVLAFFLLREKLKRIQLTGLLLTLTGMTYLFIEPIINKQVLTLGTPLGNLLVCGGLISWSSYIVLTRKISDQISPLSIIFLDFLITFIISAVLILPASLQPNFIFVKFQPNLILAIITSALISSVGFFLLSQWLIKNTSAFISSTFIYPTTLSALAYGVIFYKEKISSGLILASLLILVGVFLDIKIFKRR